MRSRPGVVALCLSATVLSACHDFSSDPLSVTLTEQTRSVLAAEASLPSLPALVQATNATGEAEAAAESWSRSWEMEVEEGRPVRMRASAAGAELLASSVGGPGIQEAVHSVGETLDAAAALKTSLLADGIAETLAQARSEHTRAVAALSAGREGEALGAALLAADLIREVGPESVSRLFLSRAEARLEALSGEELEAPAMAAVAEQILGNGDDPEPAQDPQQVDLERARRLVRGARLAIEDGDWVRAIQRAYYACQVLGIDPS
jgi:hypothetical protein